MASPEFVNPVSKLTERRREVLDWVAQCKSNWEVGMILGLTEDSVKKHLFRIYKILCVSNRMAAAQLFHEWEEETGR